jgi:hypothetical protein
MTADGDDDGVPCRCGHIDHDDETGCDHCGCPEYRPVTRYTHTLPSLAGKYLPGADRIRKPKDRP